MGANLYEMAPGTVQTASGSSGPLLTGALTTLAADVNVTAVSGTTPSMTVFVERLGDDFNWYSVWSPTAITATGSTSTSIGPGLATAADITGTIRFRWAITGTTPSFTMSVSLIAR